MTIKHHPYLNFTPLIFSIFIPYCGWSYPVYFFYWYLLISKLVNLFRLALPLKIIWILPGSTPPHRTIHTSTGWSGKSSTANATSWSIYISINQSKSVSMSHIYHDPDQPPPTQTVHDAALTITTDPDQPTPVRMAHNATPTPRKSIQNHLTVCFTYYKLIRLDINQKNPYMYWVEPPNGNSVLS